MFLSDLSIKRPILISMVLIVLLLFGSLAYFGMKLNLTPDVDIPYVTIQTVYAGAGPAETESQVTKKIEDAVSGVSEIDRMQSYSMEGVSFIVIKFNLGKNVDIASQEVKDKIDGILNDLPEDADLPVAQKWDIAEEPVIDLVLSGDLTSTQLYEIADLQLADRFSQMKGVARTTITGGSPREIQVILDDRAIYQNNLSLVQLTQILAAYNVELPGGHFVDRSQEYTVRFTGEYASVEELRNLELPTPYGKKQLKDLATVIDASEEIRGRSTFFNNLEKVGKSDVVVLSLVKASDGNAVDISEMVKQELPGILMSLPEGCRLEMVKDDSVFVKSSVMDTLNTIIMGIILTSLVLLLFLHDVRSTIIVAVAMPMSIISAFMLMNGMGFSLNIMSLMGLSTSVGVLVSNSVVVLENIFRHKGMGKSRREAASVGTSEIVLAVVAATMTNIAVFLPVASMESIIGQFFREFALTVTFATLFSLLISFTLTPMMASLILPENSVKKRRRFGDWFNGQFGRLEQFYRRVLEWILHNRRRSLLIVAASVGLLIASLPMAGQVGFEFFPLMDEGDINIEVELPLGYSLDETAVTLQKIQDIVTERSSVRHALTQLGRISDRTTGTNTAKMQIKLIDADERSMTTEQVAGALVEDLKDIPNARIRVAAVSSVGSGLDPIQLYVKGQDMSEVERYTAMIYEQIKDVPGLMNLNMSSRPGRPEVTVTPDRRKLAEVGLTVYDLAMVTRGSLAGLVSTQYKEGGEEYDIRVMLPDDAADTPEEVANIPVAGPSGTYTLGQLATIDFTFGYSKLEHTDKFKSVLFSGAAQPGVPIGNVIDEITARTNDIDFAPGYGMEWGGDAEMMGETVIDMLRTFILAVVLTYMLLAAILESLTQPLLVLGTVPLAFIGVFGAMFMAGKTMNVISMMAIVMLLGIVVNNAILILDYANILIRKQGMSVRDALIEAGPTKLKPIIMASVAIILGMLPMAMGYGDAGREMRQPMGIVSIGGLIASTFLTLVVIPALMNLTSRDKKDAVPAAADRKEIN
ncbi:MAG: efflux RND transporter permease subunit [candidate division Zixibacteria bacterium]|nr:efflux RND transporter permease subunit [candidate division Zixibacteria bacterium]